MIELNSYLPPNPALWQGRKDGKGIERYHEHLDCIDLKRGSIPKNSVCLIGFPVDQGIIDNMGREGARFGPDALRKKLAPLPLPAQKEKKLYDLGSVQIVDQNTRKAQQDLASLVDQILKNGSFPVVFGGGHEVAFGSWLGLHRAYPTSKIGILNFDAHYDLREKENLPTSGTSFYEISQESSDFHYTVIGIQTTSNTASLFKSARDRGCKTVYASEIHQLGLLPAQRAIDDLIESVDMIYLTLCLDVFAAPFAPGVSAPQPFGLFPPQVMPLLKQVIASKKVRVFDIAELSPPLDEGEKTAALAAHLVAYSLKSLIADPSLFQTKV